MKRIRQLLSHLLVLALFFSLSVTALAANSAEGTTLRLEETTGTVTVKDASGKAKRQREGMRLYSGYTLETGASSSAYISLDDSKAIKLDSLTKVEIKKSGKKLEASLTSGQLFFNVTEPLKSDESLNIRTSTMVTGVLGSFGWVNGSTVGLLHGHVQTICNNPDTGARIVTDVRSGQMVSAVTAETGGSGQTVVEFVKSDITTQAVPLVAATEVSKNTQLQEQLAEVPTVKVDELIQSLPEKQAEKAAADQAAAETSKKNEEKQSAELKEAGEKKASSGGSSNEYVFSDSTAATGGGGSSGGGGGGGSSGGGSSSGGASSVTVSEPGELASALSGSLPVVFTGNGSVSGLQIADQKSLTVAEGASLTLEGACSNAGTIANYGTLIVNGTLDNLSANTILNYGTLIVDGTIRNGGSSAGRFQNSGTVTLNSDGAFFNRVNGTVSGSPFTGSGILYHSIRFETNGGGSLSDLDVQHNTSPSSLPEPDPATQDTEFAGWYTDADLTTAWNGDKITAPITLYAKWTDPSAGTTCSVTFRPNNGSTAEQRSVAEGSKLDRPTDPIWTGQTFDNWYSDPELTTPWDFDKSTVSTDTVLYGGWKAGNLVWSLSNGALTIAGSGSMDPYSASFDASGAIQSSVPWADSLSDITSAVIGSGVSSIGDSAFFGCVNLKNLSLPDSIVIIGEGAFEGCESLTSVSLPKDLVTIGSGAFLGCDSLTGIEIPEKVSAIGEGAFGFCGALKTLTVADGNQLYQAVNNVLFMSGGEVLVCYPAGLSAGTYDVPDSVVSIAGDAFSGCGNLRAVSLGNVSAICEASFYGCTSLSEISLPENSVYIGNSAFAATGLESLTFPESTSTAVDSYAFSDCTSLKSLYLYGSMYLTGTNAFLNCPIETLVVGAAGYLDRGQDTSVKEGAETYTVTFFANGGIFNTAATQSDRIVKEVPANSPVSTPRSPDATSPNSVFDGWYTMDESGNMTSYDFDTPVVSSFSLYAGWKTRCSVSVSAGDGMVLAENSGAESQTGLTGAMTAVVYTADSNYYFPETYAVESVNGISVTRNSYTQITVSGTPTGDAELSLPDATAKSTPAQPTGLSAVACTDANNNDGQITGLDADLKYEYHAAGAAEYTEVSSGATAITGLAPGSYVVRVRSGDTSLASADSAALTVAQYTPPTYSVSVTAGEGMVLAENSGAESQTGLTGAMTAVVYTVDSNYYFPETYAVESVNGISVTRNSYTQITVSGTPTDNTTIRLTAASAKTQEDTPEATFTATGADCGTLSGVAVWMEYSLNGGDLWSPITDRDITEDCVTIASGITATHGILVVRTARSEAYLPSEPQSITVKQAETPRLTVTQPTSADGTGSINSTTAHEYSSDNGETWYDCSENQSLAEGAYLVRVKAEKNILASTAQAIDITAPEFMPQICVTEDGSGVELLSPVTGATIYYTTDGSDPVASSGSAYTGKPLLIEETTTVKAITVKGSETSKIAAETFHAVTFNAGGGFFDEDLTKTIVQIVKDGEHIEEAPEPYIPDGQSEFKFWCIDLGNGTQSEYKLETPVTKSFELTPAWKNTVQTLALSWKKGENGTLYLTWPVLENAAAYQMTVDGYPQTISSGNTTVMTEGSSSVTYYKANHMVDQILMNHESSSTGTGTLFADSNESDAFYVTLSATNADNVVIASGTAKLKMLSTSSEFRFDASVGWNGPDSAMFYAAITPKVDIPNDSMLLYCVYTKQGNDYLLNRISSVERQSNGTFSVGHRLSADEGGYVRATVYQSMPYDDAPDCCDIVLWQGDTVPFTGKGSNDPSPLSFYVENNIGSDIGVMILCETTDAVIYYATGDSAPEETEYYSNYEENQVISLEDTTTIHAFAVVNGQSTTPISGTFHVVTFDAGDGRFTDDGPNEICQIAPHNETIKPPIPWLEDCELLGWYTDPEDESGTAFDFVNSPITESLDLHAKWTSVSPDGGT